MRFVSFLFQSVSLFIVACSCALLRFVVLCCGVFFSVMLDFVALPVALANDEGLTLETSVL